jgi:ATP-binding protein involved in chromosome partitioning
VPLKGAVIVSTPQDLALIDARRGISMFKRVNVPVLGIVENMSYFVCPHCNHEIDIFSKGGGERTAQQFDVPFLGSIELDPDIRKGGDSGQPVVLEGDQSAHAKSLFKFARHVIDRVSELKAAEGGSVIEIR